MVDVFDEVEEELRKERYQQLLRTWGPWVGLVAALIVVGVAAYQFLSHRSDVAAANASDRYFAASEAASGGDLTAADEAFAALAEEGPPGYAALALLRRAAIAQEQGDLEAAARLYEQAAERSPERLLADTARYKAALARFETLSYDDIQVRLAPLQQGAAPLGALARELIAAAALREERWDEARSAYRLLAVGLDGAPGVSRRAREALVYIAQNAPEETAEPSADTAAGMEQDSEDTP